MSRRSGPEPNESTRLLSPAHDSDSDDGIAPPAGSLNAEGSNIPDKRSNGVRKRLIPKDDKKKKETAPHVPVTPDAEYYAPKKPTRRIPRGLKSIFFWGVGDIASIGTKQDLRPSDLYALEKQDYTANVTKRLEKRWFSQRGRKSMTSAVLRTWGWPLFLIMLRLVIVALLQYTGVILVPHIVTWLKDDTLPTYLGWVYTSVIITAALCVRLLNTNGNAHAYRVSWQIQSALTMMVYKKTLIVAPQKDQTSGNLITVLGSDTQTLAWVLPDILDSIVSMPRVIAAMVLLYFRIKWYAFVSIGIMLAMVPISGKLGSIIYRIASEQRKATEKRVKLINELIQGIRLVKFYVWEGPLKDNITKARNAELDIIKRMMRWQALMQFLLLASPMFIMGATFAAYGSTQPLDLETAMAVVVIIAALRSDFANLPEIVSGISQWKTSVRRIEDLMDRPELLLRPEGFKNSPFPRVVIRNATFKWEIPDETAEEEAEAEATPAVEPQPSPEPAGRAIPHPAAAAPSTPPISRSVSSSVPKGTPSYGALADPTMVNGGDIADMDSSSDSSDSSSSSSSSSDEEEDDEKLDDDGATTEGVEPFSLHNVSLEVRKAMVYAVIGGVGAGKSSLISAILGDMHTVEGNSHVAGSIAYVPQQAWILNATVRDNILLGLPYDPIKFRKVIQASCLEPDLALMPARDFTEIGERGVTMSGGQRQRISLARALYSDADVYLLDDPLSAVDSRVAASLFKHAIRGYLKNKIVILVTNQLQYVPLCDRVLYLEKGYVRAEGPFQDVLRSCPDLRELLQEQGITSDASGVYHKKKPKDKAPEEGVGQDSDEGEAKKIDDIADTPSEADDLASKVKGALIAPEHREKGYVSMRVYGYYAAAAGVLLCIVMLTVRGLMTAANISEVWWLSFWPNDQRDTKRPNHFYVGIYVGLVSFEALMSLIFLMLLTLFVYFSGRVLHERILDGIIRAPTSFFDETPVGRALARFSFDFSVVDIQMSPVLLLFIITGFQLVGTLISMSLGAYFMLGVAVPVAIVAYFFQRYYRKSAIQIRRLLSVARAPVYSHFSETLAGASSIRAYECPEEFVRRMRDKLDDQVICMLGNRWLQSWFNLRLSTLAVIVQAAAYVVVVLMRILKFGDISLASVTVSMTPNLTYGFVQVTSAMVQLEQNMNSVERVREYGMLESEPPAIIEGNRPPANWPSEGRIVFDRYTIHYNGKEKPALNALSFAIRPRERVGIVGRTGAGKSTLMLALFRMVEPTSGTICIDDIDVHTIGVEDLRRKLSIIPQEPLLFTGSVRHNLDPFGMYSEQQYWQVLETCQLKEYVSNLAGKLDAEVEEGGRNFSVGQRQLICMARALLCKSPILLLDEATASVDASTDSLIQRMIRASFPNSTVLVIAHRLNTIMDMDRILVMDDGRAVEFDTPQALLTNPKSVFSLMVEATGPASAQHLRMMAGLSNDLVKL